VSDDKGEAVYDADGAHIGTMYGESVIAVIERAKYAIGARVPLFRADGAAVGFVIREADEVDRDDLKARAWLASQAAMTELRFQRWQRVSRIATAMLVVTLVIMGGVVVVALSS